MGGSASDNSSSNKPQLSPSQMIDLYNKALPVSLATAMNQVPISVNTMANAATLANPLYTAGTLDQLGQYAGKYQQEGANLAEQQARSTANLLSGAGGDAARNAAALNASANPVQAATNRRAIDLLNSVNLNGLTAGEQNAVERGLNQSNQGTGNLGMNTQLNTVSNAMNFGNAMQNKIALLNNAVQTANTVGSNVNSQVNPLSVALNAGNTSTNFGLGQFNPSQANSLPTAPLNAATGWGSQLAGISSAGMGSSSGGSSEGHICCFIMLEAHHGVLPEHVRKCRDHYYRAFPNIASGYIRMAKWLVPMMRKSTLVREVVWYIMVGPLTQYGEFVTRKDVSQRKHRWARTLWFNIWAALGKEKQ